MKLRNTKPIVMNKIGLKIYFILLVLPQLLLATGKEGIYKKTTTINKTYTVGETGQVHIDNEYGNINIITWDKNEVTFTVTITVDGNNQNKVIERMEGIEVRINRNGDKIAAKTYIKSIKSSWNLFNWFSSNDTNFKINYTIKMPAKFDLTIHNDYGNIYLDRLEGSLNLTADYGQFELGELLNENNRITTDYFSNSSISFIKNGTIKADYSRINIDYAYKLTLACDYTHIQIDKIRKLIYNNDYGSIKVSNADEITGSGDYQSRSFSGISYLKMNGDYGSLKIADIQPEFELIKITSDYTNIKINNNKKVAYQITIKQEYGSVKYDNLEIVKFIQENGNKHLTGYYKDPDSPSKIIIEHEYGSIKISN